MLSRSAVVRLAFFVLALTSACARHDTRGTTANGSVVVWVGGGGWKTLIINADGSATYDFHATGWGSEGQPRVTTHLALARSDVDALLATLRAHRACKLRASDRHPVPEEHNQDLTLDAPGLHCAVSMLTNDWSEGPHAPAIAKALDDVAEKVRSQGTPVAP